MKEELIPCTPELEHLKIFLATVAAGRALSPEAREELYGTPVSDSDSDSARMAVALVRRQNEEILHHFLHIRTPWIGR